jgi:hypothetical protein
VLWKARAVEFQNHFAGFGRIILAIEAAERSRAPVQRLADRHPITSCVLFWEAWGWHCCSVTI